MLGTVIRIAPLGMLLLALAAAPAAAQQNTPNAADGTDFAAFLRELWPDAQAGGVARATFDAAFAGVAPDPRVIAAMTRQPEHGKPIGDYVNAIASPARIAGGKRKDAEWSAALGSVERQFGVNRHLLLAIWGLETNYGGSKGDWDVIRSLATLAQARHRHPFFRNELIAALVILQQGHIARKDMVGSWAGAMGQPQFMPSSFLTYAVDVSGDGKRDIWGNVPDVLGSIANYMSKAGWSSDTIWGSEVVVPKDFDYRKSRGSFAEWAALGLVRADAAAPPAAGSAILFFPAGARGPAFLVTGNFVAIKRYNNSDVYALSVGHLADRLRGAGPIRGIWPPDDRQLSYDERVGLQRKLADLGYPVRNTTGHFDFDLYDTIRELQATFGMVPDGHPTVALLERLGVMTAGRTR
jgi:lytic murein transglycosylase